MYNIPAIGICQRWLIHLDVFTVHWYTGTLVHWYTGTLVHWNTGTLVHCCTGKLVHWNTAAGIHYWYTGIPSLPLALCIVHYITFHTFYWRVCIDVQMYTPELAYTDGRYVVHAT